MLADDRLETFELSYDDEHNLWSDHINPPQRASFRRERARLLGRRSVLGVSASPR